MKIVFSLILAGSILAVLGLGNWLGLRKIKAMSLSRRPLVYGGLVFGELLICIISFLVLKNWDFFDRLWFVIIFSAGFVGLLIMKFVASSRDS